MKKVGMILQSPFPPDIRVEKEAKTLLEAGYNVFLLAGYNGGQKKEEIVDGIRVRRVNIATDPFLKKVCYLIFCLTFNYPFWKKEIEKFVSDFDIEILHIHDLPLVKTGIEVGKINDLPIVADLHENYPVALQIWMNSSKGVKKLLLSFLNNLKRWTVYEKECTKDVDMVIVVVEEAKEHLLKYGISEQKIVVISNVVDIERFSKIAINESIPQKYKENFVISYIGGFAPHRGIECAIKAMSYLGKGIKGARLVLVGGEDKDYIKELRRLALRYKVYHLVDFVGWQPLEKIPSYIRASDICLVPHNKNPHTDATIPHKLFQYMLIGRPVLVSSCKPLKRVVEATNSGVVFEAGNEKDLADKILDLYNREDLRSKFSKNGKEAVQKQYNWQIEGKKLINLYGQLGNYHRGRRFK